MIRLSLHLQSFLVFIVGVASANRLSSSCHQNYWRLQSQGLTTLYESQSGSCSVGNKFRFIDVNLRNSLTGKTLQSKINIRGGASTNDNDDHDIDDYDESDFDEDDMMMFDDMDDMMEDDDAFGEDSTVTRLMESWQKTPPFTKAYLSASIGATLLGYLTQKNHEFPPYFSLEWKKVLTRFHVWRPLTAFLNFGTLGIGYILTLNFVWTYMSTLERLNHDHPYDFWYMIFFGCMSMVTGYAFLGLSPRFLGHNLSTFLVYIWSRYHEGLEVNMFELFNTRAEMLPWFFLAQTFLLEGELPILDLLGIFFGHVYYHLKHCKMLITPRFIVNWYNTNQGPLSTAIRKKYREISSDYEMQ